MQVTSKPKNKRTKSQNDRLIILFFVPFTSLMYMRWPKRCRWHLATIAAAKNIHVFFKRRSLTLWTSFSLLSVQAGSGSKHMYESVFTSVTEEFTQGPVLLNFIFLQNNSTSYSFVAKKVSLLQAHSVLRCDPLWACRSAILAKEFDAERLKSGYEDRQSLTKLWDFVIAVHLSLTQAEIWPKT